MSGTSNAVGRTAPAPVPAMPGGFYVVVVKGGKIFPTVVAVYPM